YGTIPIVNDTGGLSDTIIDLSLPGGTGFKMIAYTAKALDLAIQRAMDLYAQPVNLNKVRKTGMKKDFSWKTTAQAYISLYEKLLAS
ncbi:MAG: starch synthase, partial [Candidatus Omnitrophota bacterium]